MGSWGVKNDADGCRGAARFVAIKLPLYVWLDFDRLSDAKAARVNHVRADLDIVPNSDDRARGVRLKAAVPLMREVTGEIKFKIDAFVSDDVGCRNSCDG